IGDNKKHREIVKEIKKIYGYDIVTLPFKEFDQYFGDVQIRDAGPCEFLGLVKNAEIICTDSFHGILFSIIFKKNFYTFKRFEETDMYNQNARVINIINKLNLKERIIENVKDIDITKIIDYEKVYEKLKTEKKKSIKFLKNALD
ncbi:MAG: polysaccharide pyruvyl transferase family protein, partial [Bacilli bacterium]|nr:polysaccharide pyruvyl transferase family protein [Bacilli bacterium]